MSKKLICPNCEQLKLVEPVCENRSISVKGESFSVSVHLWKCLDCHQEFDDPEKLCDELDDAYRQYRVKHGLLQPEEIKKLRESLTLTQQELALLLGWSPATICRYENGALQEKSHDQMLQVLKDPLSLHRLLIKNDNIFPKKRHQELMNYFSKLIDQKRNDYMMQLIISRQPDIFSGNVTFNPQKYAAVIQFFTGLSSHRRIPKTKMNKLLFYTDFFYFRKKESSLTGSVYTHEPYGPCPSNFQFLFDYFIEQNFLELNEFIPSADRIIEMISCGKNQTVEILENNEKKILFHIFEKLGHLNASELSRLSHLEKGYTLTQLKEPISYEYSKYLSLI